MNGARGAPYDSMIGVREIASSVPMIGVRSG